MTARAIGIVVVVALFAAIVGCEVEVPLDGIHTPSGPDASFLPDAPPLPDGPDGGGSATGDDGGGLPDGFIQPDAGL